MLKQSSEKIEPKKVLEWQNYFMQIARTASQRSNCLRANVGAVIANGQNYIVSTGYNGTPKKVISCLERNSCFRMDNNIPSGTMYESCRSVHAEMNAIIQAGAERTQGCSMYVYGHNMICIMCRRFIVQAGIKEVFLQKDDKAEIISVSFDELKCSL